MTATDTTSAQALLALFRAEFPDIEDFVLSVNSEVLSAKNPEAAGVIERILSGPKDYESAYYPIRLIREIVYATGLIYDDEENMGRQGTEEEISAYIMSDWSFKHVTELARMHAFRATAHDLNMTLSELIISEATTDLIHGQLMGLHRTNDHMYTEWYWRGIALLHVYVRDHEKRDALDSYSAQSFVWWVGEQEDPKTAADLFMERKTIDVRQLDALLNVNKQLATPLRKGSL